MKWLRTVFEVCVCWSTCVRNICGPHDASDLLHGLQIGRETCAQYTHNTQLC